MTIGNGARGHDTRRPTPTAARIYIVTSWGLLCVTTNLPYSILSSSDFFDDLRFRCILPFSRLLVRARARLRAIARIFHRMALPVSECRLTLSMTLSSAAGYPAGAGGPDLSSTAALEPFASAEEVMEAVQMGMWDAADAKAMLEESRALNQAERSEAKKRPRDDEGEP